MPSLREWMTRAQRATRRGRFALRLDELAHDWNASPENRHLPNWWEHLNIRTLTRRRRWTEPQRAMMRTALRVHGRNLILILVVVFGLSWFTYDRVGHHRAEALVRSILLAEIEDVPQLVQELNGLRGWADPQLMRSLEQSSKQSKTHLRANLALLECEPQRLPEVMERLLTAPPREFQVIRQMLIPYRQQIVQPLWDIWSPSAPARYTQEGRERRFRAASRWPPWMPMTRAGKRSPMR